MELLIRETDRRVLIMKALFQSQFYKVKKWEYYSQNGQEWLGQDKVE